jgi:hypothetical protein
MSRTSGTAPTKWTEKHVSKREALSLKDVLGVKRSSSGVEICYGIMQELCISNEVNE